MAETKTFLKCSAKASKYGIRVGIKVEDLIAFAKQHGNDRGYLNLEIKERREVGQYGDTHSVTLDTFDPRRQSDGAHVTASDVPFAWLLPMLLPIAGAFLA